MRRLLPPALVALAALALAAAPASAQDPAGEPVIPPGAKAGGLDVGGLTLSAAAAKLDATFAAPLAQDIQVRVAGKRFTLANKDLGFTFDSLKTARRANVAARAVAPAPDGTVATDVPLAATLTSAKLAAQVARIDAATTQPARDATVRITLRHMRVRKARPGASLAANKLAQQLTAVAIDPAAARILRATRDVVHPKVRVTDLKRGRYATVVTVDQSHFRLRVFKRLKLSKSYGVAVGQPAYPTPNGLFSIVNKAVNPTWTVPDSPWAGALRNESVPGGSDQNPLKARWMGIVNGVGIHGTADSWSIGSRASHGCIRMTVSDVIDLYPRVPVGTPVLIG
jgi:lipoprotein-anchoring transpeptidase ErfK/SrfK